MPVWLWTSPLVQTLVGERERWSTVPFNPNSNWSNHWNNLRKIIWGEEDLELSLRVWGFNVLAEEGLAKDKGWGRQIRICIYSTVQEKKEGKMIWGKMIFTSSS